MTAELAKQVATLRKTQRALFDLKGWILLEKLAAWCKGTPPTCATSVSAIRNIFGWHRSRIVDLLDQFERRNILYRKRRYQEPTLFILTLERLSESSGVNFHFGSSESTGESTGESSPPYKESAKEANRLRREPIMSALRAPAAARKDEAEEGPFPEEWLPRRALIERLKKSRPSITDAIIDRRSPEFEQWTVGKLFPIDDRAHDEAWLSFMMATDPPDHLNGHGRVATPSSESPTAPTSPIAARERPLDSETRRQRHAIEKLAVRAGCLVRFEPAQRVVVYPVNPAGMTETMSALQAVGFLRRRKLDLARNNKRRTTP